MPTWHRLIGAFPKKIGPRRAPCRESRGRETRRSFGVQHYYRKAARVRRQDGVRAFVDHLAQAFYLQSRVPDSEAVLKLTGSVPQWTGTKSI